MKHIVFLVDQLHLKGGIERLVAMKANYWSEEFGYKVSIISTEQKKQAYSFELSPQVDFIDLGINYHRDISYFHPKNLIKLTQNIFKLRRELKKLTPSHIIVASHIPITYVINFMKGDAKTIKEYHFTKFFRAKKRSLKQKIEERIESLYDFNVVLSEEEKTYHRTNNLIAIPNPIEINSNFKVDFNQTNKMLFVGRIAEVKNLEDMVDIWALFIKRYPKWILDIYGDDQNQYASKIKDKIEKLGASKNIILKGNINNPNEVFNEYEALLLSSHQECFPMVILEANAHGLPVISFDSPTGPRNMIIHNKNGFLVPLYNKEIFVDILVKFAENPNFKQQHFSNVIKQAKYFDIKNIMLRWKNDILERSEPMP
ncbi:glycosyltransferase [Weeksellaceae bacterium KMM 9713]|uniref:Glycosyltransferase n=1 Tax=Profundicola chukchiensis TaxID=2961959 RepID=A0A9X4MWC5_9FLAO|nr:glycosyltransferase [Profundicola chukchiensis]MDG4944800.1 glycosyltransferase [Profundicola chukchiensis]